MTGIDCRTNHHLVFMMGWSRWMNRVLCAVCLLIVVASTSYPIPSSAANSHEYRKPEDVVAWLYRDFSWVAVMGDQYWKNDSLIEQPRQILALYFSDELVSLIMKDREYVKETHELGNLNFDPIFASQDPSADDLKISSVDKSDMVHVQYVCPYNQKQIKLDFKVERTTHGWRISDIVYENGVSLKKILRGDKGTR